MVIHSLRAAWLFLLFIRIVKGKDGCKELLYLHCQKNKTFTGHVIKSFRIVARPGSLAECQNNCFRVKECVSYNLGRIDGQIRTCELNRLDHVTHPNDVIDRHGWEYCPIENHCSSSPCTDGKVCLPDFYWDTFACSDGMWSQWSQWSTCHCTSRRTRSCLNPFTNATASDCPGTNLETKEMASASFVAKNCAELVSKCGDNDSCICTVNPDGVNVVQVFCDQETNGGGWIVIQRRQDGSQDFYLGWHKYKVGFGDLNGEFWLGLDNIHRITRHGRYRLRVELEDSAYAEYDDFAVSDEANKYTLSLGIYSGNAGDAFDAHRDKPFTTKDRDHDSHPTNCAVKFQGAWWYNRCHASNLNGLYLNGTHTDIFAQGINWKYWKGHRYSAKRVEMKIRPT